MITSTPRTAVGPERPPAPPDTAGIAPGPPIGLGRRRLLVARVASVVAIVAGGAYLAWRTPQLAGVGAMGDLLYVAEVVNYLWFAVVAFLLWRPRWRRPPPPFEGSLDILLPVCGEHPSIVEHNVRAALAVTYPHRTVVCNDGWLAGRSNWYEINALCDELGVRCVTRTSGPRGKAGNLNFALERTDGEFVAVIDADHNARANLGELTMGYFADPRVGFVASKQSFLVGTTDPLGHQELFFYDSMQPAKDADNAAFSCGNGVLYRRAALDEVGGFAEWNVVEDLTTSYEMHARGWHSAYVPTPVTVGLAPLTAAEYTRQRLRWATDALRLFFWDNPVIKRGLSLRQRLHYLLTTGWYLVAALYLVFVVAPVASVFLEATPIQVDSVGGYLARLFAYLLPLGVFMVAHAGWRGALRPVQAQLYLAPVYLVAIARALFARPQPGVTSKGRELRFSVPTGFQHAVLLLLLAAIGVGLARDDRGDWGAVLWACLLAAALANPSSMITRRRDDAQALRVGVTAVVAAAAATVVLAAWAPAPGGVLPAQSAGPAEATALLATSERRAARRADRQPRLALLPPRHGVYLGAHSRELAHPDLGVSRWRAHRARLRIAHEFLDWWGHDPAAPRAWMQAVAAQQGVPMITWEPWRKPRGSVQDPHQRPAVLSRIASGAHDPYVRRFARAVAAHRGPVLIRLAHEMNGSWYPWSIGIGRNTSRAYVRAWRHVHRIFERQGAANASWVWSIESFAGGAPTRRSTLDSYYPGRRFVDWVGLSGFNWGGQHPYGGWLSFRGVFDRAYDVVAGYRKPVMIAETGTAATGGDAGAWVRNALRTVRTDYPRVRALVFYDARHPAQDFRLGDDGYAGLRSGTRGRFWRPAPRLVEAPRQE